MTKLPFEKETTIAFTLRLPESVWAEISEHAQEFHISRNDAIRRCLTQNTRKLIFESFMEAPNKKRMLGFKAWAAREKHKESWKTEAKAFGQPRKKPKRPAPAANAQAKEQIS